MLHLFKLVGHLLKKKRKMLVIRICYNVYVNRFEYNKNTVHMHVLSINLMRKASHHGYFGCMSNLLNC